MYRLAPDVELRSGEGGHFLVAPRPLRALKINGALKELALRCRDHGALPDDTRHMAALEALARKGYLIRERAPRLAEAELPTVSVVIPVRDRAEELERCLRSLGRVRYPPHQIEVIVVDDGSRDSTPAVARRLGATVVPSGGAGRGPAASRNRGAAEARGDILAFIDSDCTASPDWLRDLVGAFVDSEVWAVGGRVEGMHAATGLDRYEAAMSSLSLGKRERAGREGDDTFYLPSCNLLVRRGAFLEAGGFREDMHVGEDVDLTWRLRDRGGRILYVPRGWVWHEHRNRLGAFLRRRFEYGTSEALLQARHPRRRKRVALPPLPTAVLILACVGVLGGGWLWAVGAAALFGVDVFWVRVQFGARGLWLPVGEVLRARWRTLGSLVYYLGGHGLRYYGVPALLVSALWPSFGVLLLGAWAGVGLMDHRVKKPSLGALRFLSLYLAEMLAYGAGVFRGCLGQGSFGTYKPVIYRRMEMSFG